jgi:hypothetical protein
MNGQTNRKRDRFAEFRLQRRRRMAATTPRRPAMSRRAPPLLRRLEGNFAIQAEIQRKVSVW